MSLILRTIKGSALTYNEGDANLLYLESLMTGGTSTSALEDVLIEGNETNGNDIQLSDGDKLFNSGVNTIAGLELDPDFLNNGTRLYVEDTVTGDFSNLELDSTYFAVNSESISFLMGSTTASIEIEPTKVSVFGEGENSILLLGDGVLTDEKIEIKADQLIFKPTNGVFKIEGIITFADNAAAIAGGLTVNSVYKTATGELRIVV